MIKDIQREFRQKRSCWANLFEFFEDTSGKKDKENLEDVASLHFKKNLTGFHIRDKCLRKKTLEEEINEDAGKKLFESEEMLCEFQRSWMTFSSPGHSVLWNLDNRTNMILLIFKMVAERQQKWLRVIKPKFIN